MYRSWKSWNAERGSTAGVSALPAKARAAGEGLYFLLFPVAIAAAGLLVGALALTLARTYFDLVRQIP